MKLAVIVTAIMAMFASILGWTKSYMTNVPRKETESISPMPNTSITPTNTNAPTAKPITVTTAPTAKPDTSDSGKMWGAYAGAKLSDYVNFQNKVGENIDIAAVFVHWGNENEFPKEIGEWAKKNNKTMLIYWEAMDYNNATSADARFSYNEIIKGKWDSYIKSFAQSVKEYGGKVIILPFEEMNGDWYAWSGTKNGNTPALHVEAYRHIKNLFAGVSNAKFGWAVNNDSVPDTQENRIEAYYPGDAYVDYVGIDGFNFGDPWQTFDDVFAKPLATLRQYKKPIMIFSMACAQGEKKSAWIEDAIQKLKNDPQIVGWIWFNENKEKNWLVWSDNQSVKSFSSGVNDY